MSDEVRGWVIMARIRTLWRAAAVVAGIILLALAICIWQGVHTSLEAEKTLHAEWVIFFALEKYVHDNPDSWPKSWQELSLVRLPSSQQSGMFRWPEDVDKIRQRVHVNFDLTRADVEAMNVETFSGFKPIGPHYEDDDKIESFLRDIRELRSQKR